MCADQALYMDKNYNFGGDANSSAAGGYDPTPLEEAHRALVKPLDRVLHTGSLQGL